MGRLIRFNTLEWCICVSITQQVLWSLGAMVISDSRHKQGNYRAAHILGNHGHYLGGSQGSADQYNLDHTTNAYQCAFWSSVEIAKVVKNRRRAGICKMQIYLQILWIICYPVSRDQFVNLCPAKMPKFGLDSSSNFADHGLDSSSKVNLFRLAFVQ